MPPSRLTALQERVLVALATIAPPWTLTGGGALTGIHYGHRDTRDLDLFWHGLDQLQRLPEQVSKTLRAAGMDVSSVQIEPAFHQLLVSADGERVVVDLVANPVPVIDWALIAIPSALGISRLFQVFLGDGHHDGTGSQGLGKRRVRARRVG